MNEEILAENYVTRLKRCLTAVKILICVTVALIAALVIFAAVAAGTGLNESSPAATLLTVVILGGFAALAAVAVFVCFSVAYKTLSSLKKLGSSGGKSVSRENEVE